MNSSHTEDLIMIGQHSSADVHPGQPVSVKIARGGARSF